jgi:hypothetical protein
MASSSTPKPPAERASEIIDKVPSSNLVTKTGTIILGSGLLATAISQELYVLNEETVLLAGAVILFTYLAKACRFAVLKVNMLISVFRQQGNRIVTGPMAPLIKSSKSLKVLVLDTRKL